MKTSLYLKYLTELNFPMRWEKELFWILFVIIPLFLVSCTKTINIGVDIWPPCEVWYVADYLKLPAKENLKLKIVRYPTWRSAVESFYQGNLDVVHSSYFNTIYYCNKGIKAKIGIIADRGIGLDGIVVSPKIERIEELRGKTIGVELGTDEYFLLYKILKNHSLELKDVRIVSIASWKAPEYLRNGKLDGVVTYEPYLSQAAKYGRIAETTLQYPDIIMDAIMFSDSLANNKKISEKMRNIWFDTVRWIFDSPSNFKKASLIMARAEGINPEEFDSLFESFYFFSRSDNSTMLVKGGMVESVLRSMEDFLIGEKLIHSRCSTNRLILR